jgi:hypothetical protein
VKILWIVTLLALCLTSNYRIAAAQKVRETSLRERLEQIANSYAADNTFMRSVLVARGNDILKESLDFESMSALVCSRHLEIE